ncbi:zinc ribbon domain-containing protein [Fusibacter paucivorans]|uniref:Zinc ribbon domain-containing protein n=1 Tax=Fusibacter paucivorans TaxID=76009 RepID=A0ABS5PM09_9FIRM|nr:zinc ribbon domain-containing protein [Fusibacter paucivorans]MBS7526209.1 zinc ribbon domain-containing protein [Fusibacter paucivorans]
MNCHRCGQEISRFAKTCKYCGAPVVRAANTSADYYATNTENNRSSSLGRQREAVDAEEREPERSRSQQTRPQTQTKPQRQSRHTRSSATDVYKVQRKWSWGAFTFTWIWGLFNGTYIAFLTLLPMFGILFKIFLGVKGNTWAYQNRKWESDQHYVDTMHKWNLFGFIGFLVWCLIIAGYALMMFNGVSEIHHFETTAVTEVPAYEEAYEDWDLYDEGSMRNEDAFFDSYTTEGVLISDILIWGFDNTAISFIEPDSLDGGTATVRSDIVYMNVPAEATLVFERESEDVYRCTAVYLDDLRLDEEAQKTFLSELYDAVQWDYPDTEYDLDEDVMIEKTL